MPMYVCVYVCVCMGMHATRLVPADDVAVVVLGVVVERAAAVRAAAHTGVGKKRMDESAVLASYKGVWERRMDESEVLASYKGVWERRMHESAVSASSGDGGGGGGGKTHRWMAVRQPKSRRQVLQV